MAEHKQRKRLDGFARRYLYVLSGLLFAGIVWWISNLDFRVAELNELLEADPTLASYPYPFRVLSLENGIARMTSPRSAQMSAIQSLRIMFPELQHSSALSDEMQAAQQRLATIQSSAAKVVGSQEDVSRVQWILDERWLAEHGVFVQ